MKYRDFISLTDEEITEVVTDMFNPIEIKNIKHNHDKGTISFDMKTDWNNGTFVDYIWDNIVLANPFECGHEAIWIEGWDATAGQYLTFKQFCLAKGIVNQAWIENNPYLKEDNGNEG